MKRKKEWVECTAPFSNGTEFMLFIDGCLNCSYYRNSKCKILNKCFEAQHDISKFPYEYLLDHYKYGGKRCKRKTTEQLKRHRKIRDTKNQLKMLEES